MRLRPRDFAKTSAFERLLLPVVRSKESAAQELRWIKEELPAHKVRQAVLRRARFEPLQYILGTQPFGHLDIKVARGVLIPRWETEEWALDLYTRLKGANLKPSIADLFTGTGCIGFLLATKLGTKLTSFDVSPLAEQCYLTNLTQLRDINAQFVKADLLESSSCSGFNAELVVANPPYITPQEFCHVEPSVLRYEPHLALKGDDSTYVKTVARILELGSRAAVIEAGNKHQLDLTAKLLENYGWQTRVKQDSAGKWRTVWAWRSEEFSILGA